MGLSLRGGCATYRSWGIRREQPANTCTNPEGDTLRLLKRLSSRGDNLPLADREFVLDQGQEKTHRLLFVDGLSQAGNSTNVLVMLNAAMTFQPSIQSYPFNPHH